MKIYDYFSNFKQYYNKDASEGELYNLWLAYMKDKEELRNLCINDYEDNDFYIEDIVKDRVFCFTHKIFSKMLIAYKNIKDVLDNILSKIENHYPIMQIDMNIVIYHGLANSAGWVTNFEGKQSILFGIEKIAELNWHTYDTLEALVSHELAHVVHFDIRRFLEEYEDPYKEGIIRLYQEGFAQYYQSVFLEKKIDSRGSVWYDSCLENIQELKKLYKIALNDPVNGCNDFFGDWYKVLGISDVGYFLGEKVIEKLSQNYTMSEIALLDFAKIEQEVQNFLNT